MKMSLELQQAMFVLVLLAVPLLSISSGCACSQTVVRAKPLLPSISVKHILLEKGEGSASAVGVECGHGQGACACGCQSMSGFPAMAACQHGQQHLTSSPSLTSQNGFPTNGYSPHSAATTHCCYSNSHLYASPPGYITPTSPSSSTTTYTHYPQYQSTYTHQSQPHCPTVYASTPVSCNSKSTKKEHEEDCSCSEERKSSRRRSSSRKSGRKSSERRKKCDSSEEDESSECRQRPKTAFQGCIKLPFFHGSIMIGH